ncbi:MAG: amidohydrolase [Acidibacillus sp.]|uniref:5-methylthioadenosine/S-adenosylhomocysteine deaminase n=1 Tax=Sulfoacidibacillus ferrooxidans TaxID=2005001 RepID=A0A9X1V8U1_9BACL|nr:amidohydrolase [Sulfoacidibacillus ferrooxidans]MCI0182915.1 5-methylthioadenosine/S-adenosylhomocysteine deaminase [Sulfoacidibacillus ferrooxidans]MCY0893512.1 amidohydrolase [Acidibacillus sp.]
MITLYKADYAYIAGQFEQDRTIAVQDDLIIAIGPFAVLRANYPDAPLIDWSGYAIMPGAINAHNHSFQSLLRGIATDEPFLVWRDQALYKYTPALDAKTLYAGALLAFGEMLQYGVTTVTDFFYVHGNGTENDEAIMQAADDLGIRFVMARTMYDWSGAPLSYRETVSDAVLRTRTLAKKYDAHPRISVHPAPHSPHAASPEMIKAGHRLAQELDTPFHIHVAEEMFEVNDILRDYGVRPIHYLDQLGVVDDSMIAIHLVWLEQDEIDLLGARRASLAYCPSSNMFLADGVTKIPELLQAGVRIGLGTDGACSNNRTSVFEEMRMTALLQKVHRLDATAIRASDTLLMGTQAGADMLRLRTGQLTPTYLADFIAIDTTDLSLQPFAKELLPAHVVYSMQPTAIKRVVVAGKEVMRDGTLLTVHQERIRTLVAEAQEHFARI